MTAQEIIRQLNLQKHPKEGGYFRETYRSPLSTPREQLPPAYSGPRSFSTAIYYLITPDSFSAMHCLPGEEIFHHYLGDPVEMLLLHADGRSEIVTMGKDLSRGHVPQVVVPASTWQGSRLIEGGSFALLGCTMSPGFDYADYQHGSREELMRRYPSQAQLIGALTTEPR
jgi:predicted cupin superfamily sugar epimerase